MSPQGQQDENDRETLRVSDANNRGGNHWRLPSDLEYKTDPHSVISNDITAGTALTLLTALRAANVEFVRYGVLDASGEMRCKAVPIDRLLQDPMRFYYGVPCIAEICFAGLPSYADYPAAGSNLTAERVLTVNPDVSSLRVLPYAPSSALVMGTAHDQRTGKPSPLCTRHLLSRVKRSAEKEFGLAFTVGAELEFCLVHEETRGAVDKTVFARPAVLNEQDEFITNLYRQLREQSIGVELIHAESAHGQVEVVLTHQDDVMRIADNVVFARETVKACARAHGLRAIFLPKVYGEQAGNGLHIHISFRDLSVSERQNAFHSSSKSGHMSDKGCSFLEGILQHLSALLSITIPSANSFRRVGPGCWTGHSVGWAVEDKEAPLRVCFDSVSGDPTNVELKLSDSMSNIYLSLAATLSAGLDGIAKDSKLRPFIGSSGEDAGALPKTFEDSLECLKGDTFLMDILGEELSTGYIAVRAAEALVSSEMSLEDEVKNAFERA